MAIVLCVAVMLPAAGVAAVPREHARRNRISGISWSGERLWQVLVNERHLEFRIYADGQKQLFKLNFGPTDTGAGMLMTLTIAGNRMPMQFMYTVEALDYLESLGVTQVRGFNGEDQILHGTDELRTMLLGETHTQPPGDAENPSVLENLPIQSDPTLEGEDPMLP